MNLTVKDVKSTTSAANGTTIYTLVLQLEPNAANNVSQGQLQVNSTAAFSGVKVGDSIPITIPGVA